ncbi:hypothetical protein EJ02DRAFT_410981 [Clathrospora elynae]|uniref:DNA-binding protein RAP1 n=1 Tax=Clathrospora elynae TaxID=706981 RepID=A0A6A5SE69_9PLEO|nr:hypothetical protein EJ02DRAFT_410981 [Clathrospora elynae]
MAAPTVYTDIADGFDFGGELFAGKKFWVAQRVPSRHRLLDDIKANGGEVVTLEKKADYLIADHFRRDCPPGSISYEFIEKSVRHGELGNPDDHRAGPPLGEAREPGAVNRPAKGSRAAYTPEEDRILHKWVRDAEQSGGLASGNEIYKQLEAKYPRHTWQSWRDRYLKQLRNRPPSAFNIPDNAPPSPPSDQSYEPKPEKTPAANKVSGPGTVRTTDDYGLDDLAALFTSEAWEELYAFVDIIDGLVGEECYDASWAAWATAQGKQTAAQWRQYYEKIVRPQWLRDPLWKREQIKKKVENKHEGGQSSQSQPPSQQAQEADKHGQAFAAYKFYAREQKPLTLGTQPSLDFPELHPELHRILWSEWRSLSDQEKAPYFAMVQAITERTLEEAKIASSGVKVPSSSTVRHESPKYLTEIYDKALKRSHGHAIIEELEQEEQVPRPLKRRKSSSATPTRGDRVEQTEVVGTQAQPFEISSAESSISNSQSEAAQDPIQDQTRQDYDATVEDYDEEAEQAAESVESDNFPDIDQLPVPPEGYETESADDLPADTPTPTPTPRANRQKASNFDTQAILSSQTQPPTDKLPRPHGYTQADPQGSSSPTHHLDSDASTTQSLQEFRRSLNEDEVAQLSYPQLPPQHSYVSPSPAPSRTSSISTDSGDPDPPLAAHELDEFFDEQHAQDFNDDFIVRALKRTRLRPELAVKVLDAWRRGDSLPHERGIWSIEDDDAVESGDGVALADLERKHSLDGWGGITERMLFLEAERSR